MATPPRLMGRPRTRCRITDAGADIAAAEDEPPDPETGPLRRCIVTRESGPKAGLIRFVIGPGREVVPDLAARLPGRGMWLSARRDVLETALARGAFARAARGSVVLPADLSLRIEDGLRRRVRDLLGFARRAGQAISGRDAVRDWMRAGRAGLLVEASDGSLAERERLIGRSELRVVAPLPAAVLGVVFGREHAVHVAVAPGRLAEAIAVETGRLLGVAAVPVGGAGDLGNGGRAKRPGSRHDKGPVTDPHTGIGFGSAHE